MTYKIGTRVRKVRDSLNLGATGVVCNGPGVTGGKLEFPGDMYVRHDQPWHSYSGHRFPAGTVSVSTGSDWEPILNSHEPCESEFKESLDKLLSEVRDGQTV